MKIFHLLLIGLFALNTNSLTASSLPKEVSNKFSPNDSTKNLRNADAEDFRIQLKKTNLSQRHKEIISSLSYFEDKLNERNIPLDEKYRNSNFFYTLMPIYQSNGTIGLEMGELNLNGIGWFGSLKANLGVTKAASPYDEVDRPSIEKEDYDLGAASLSLGITKSIVYPLYLYAGGGVAYHKYYTENSDDDVIAVNLNDESGYYLFPEAALGVQFGSMAIKGGAAYIDEEVYFNIGIGFGG